MLWYSEFSQFVAWEYKLLTTRTTTNPNLDFMKLQIYSQWENTEMIIRVVLLSKKSWSPELEVPICWAGKKNTLASFNTTFPVFGYLILK